MRGIECHAALRQMAIEHRTQMVGRILVQRGERFIQDQKRGQGIDAQAGERHALALALREYPCRQMRGMRQAHLVKGQVCVFLAALVA